MNERVTWLRGIGTAVGAGLLLACGGAQTTGPAPPPASAPQATEPPRPATAPTEPAPTEPAQAPEATVDKVKFVDMDPKGKLNVMKTVVAPEMAKLFQSVDAEKYKDFGCVTCHGPGAKEGKFDMPSSTLPKLPKNIGDVFKSSPDMAKFMSERVLPKMAEILGEEPFNPETHQGFGCRNCHQQL